MSDTDSVCPGPDEDFDLAGELEGMMSDNDASKFDAAPVEFSDFVMSDYTGIDFDWEEPTAAPPKRRRLTCKTSAIVAVGLGYSSPEASDSDDADSDVSLAEEDIPTEAIEVPVAAMDVHGGLFLQTDSILWCAKCGASAKLGWSSAYLRIACPGKPVNDSMKQRRKRLIRGKHPTTCKPLLSAPKRVRII